MESHNSQSNHENYLVISVKIGGKEVRALLDTGAQPCVLKKSCVPIGTPIKKQNMSLQGINGPKIQVYGTADIVLEVGNTLFTKEMVIVEDKELTFPAHTQLIIGANLLVHNQLDISTRKWGILQDGEVLKHLEPAWIDGSYFSQTEADYLENSDGFNKPELEVEDETQRALELSCCSSGRGVYQERPDVNKIKNKEKKYGKSVKFYPKESLPQGNQYSVTTQANISIPSLQLSFVKPQFLDEEGLEAPHRRLMEVNGGLIAPGVIQLRGVATREDNIAIINCTAEDVELKKGIPFATARLVSEEDVMYYEQEVGSKEIKLQSQEVYTLMAISSITEEAYVTPEEYESEPDNLQQALEYDPAEIVTDKVQYNQERFSRLLNCIDRDHWELTRQQRDRAEQILFKNQRAFHLEGEKLPQTHLLEHDIILTDPSQIVNVKPRWTPFHQRPHIDKEIDGLLNHDLAGETNSPYSSPVVLVKKGDSAKAYRLAIDYRALNKITLPQHFPCANIEEVLFKISKSKIHSTFDLKAGFHQIRLKKRARKYTAFSSHRGHHEFYVTPFGLVNSPHSMNRLMCMVFSEYSEFVSYFFDDIYVHSDSVEDHLTHLDIALKALIEANLQVGVKKTKLFGKEVQVLGHLVGGGNIKPGFNKTSAIENFPTPKNKTNVRSFLGLSGFFRRFVHNYAVIAKPLTQLTKEDVPFQWGPQQEEAFNLLKQHLTREPILKAPDFGRTWFLISDACDIGIAAWLGQKYDGKIRPVAYFSRQMRKSEETIKRDPMEQECLSIVEALKKFRPLIWGQRIVILSDNSALTWLFNKCTYKSPRLTRWALCVQSFSAEILHLPGTLNKIADSLSRNPEPIEIGEEEVEKAHKLLDKCEETNISLIGIFKKGECPSQKETLLRIASMEQQEEDTDDDPQQAWTLEELKKKQDQDIALKPIIEYIKNPSDINKMKVDPNIKDLNTYFLDPTQVLFKTIEDPKAELRENEEVIVIPYQLQELATSIVHDTVLGGHTATERTIFAAKRRFYWRRMNSTIQKYVEKCRVCQLNKGNAHKKLPLRKYPIPDKTFEVISTDLIGPLNTTPDGNKYILVVTDFLSHYAVVKAIPNKKGDTVAQALWEIFCEHGCPTILYSDSGCEFRNAIMSEMAKNLHFQHVQVAVYHPASNGLCERKNSAILTALKCFLNEGEWDKCLPTAQLAVNAAYCVSLGDSPFYVYKGKDPELPITRFAKPKFSYEEPLTFEKERQRREYFVMEKVKEKLEEATDRNCRQRAKKCKDKTLNIGDRVFIKKIRGKGEDKLAQKWRGPFRIKAQKNPGVYKLRDLRSGKITEQHIENIKDQIIAREAEIPLAECPEARLAFPRAEVVEAKSRNKDANTPEGAHDDNWVDDSFWLNYAPPQEPLGYDEDIPENAHQPKGRKKSPTQIKENRKPHENQHKMITRNKAR